MFLTYQVRDLVDSITNNVSFNVFLVTVYKIIIFGILSFGLTLYQTKRWQNFRYVLINSMRTTMYKSLIKKSNTFFDKHTTGDIVSKVMNDGTSVAENAGIQILMVILNIFRVLVVLIILLTLNLKLGLILLPILPVYFILLVKISGRMRIYSLEEKKAFANVQQKLIENINGIREIQMFNKFKYFTDKFDISLNIEYFSRINKIINCQVLMYALNNVMIIFLPVIILLFGAYLAFLKEISIGILVAFYTYIGKLLEPLSNLADAYQGSRIALGSADRIYDFIFDQEKSDRNIKFLDKFKTMDINIYNYAWNDKEIFRNLSLKIDAEDRILIIGESGRGKSTLLKLIMNYYEDIKGSIRINDVDMAKIEKESLYKNILQVHQEPFIFEGTIKENLTLGDSILEKDLDDVVKIVCLENIIEEKGWNYGLSEDGSNISRGQKQRIAIARVLLKKPQLLILDEATSALDINTEKKLIDNLEKYLIKNKITLIAVSHNNNMKSICNKEFII